MKTNEDILYRLAALIGLCHANGVTTHGATGEDVVQLAKYIEDAEKRVVQLTASVSRQRIVLRNARVYAENFTSNSTLPSLQSNMIGQIDEVLHAADVQHPEPADTITLDRSDIEALLRSLDSDSVRKIKSLLNEEST